MFPSKANASDLSAALSIHYIVAASCFLRSESCILMVFDACAWTMSVYSLASLTMSFFIVNISFRISSVHWMTTFSTNFSKSTLL